MKFFGVVLGLKNAQFNSGLDQSKKKVSEFKADASSSFGSLGAKIAGVFSVAAITSFFNSIVQRSDQIKDVADRFNVGTEALQRMGNVAEKEGSSLESVASALNKVEIARSKALGGDAGMLEDFRGLGVTIEDLRSLGPDELLTKIGKSSMDAAALVSVLGKNALELRNTLSKMEGADAGGIIKDEDVQRLAQMKDDSMSMLRNLQSIGARVAGPIVGGLRAFFSGFTASNGVPNFSMQRAKDAYAASRVGSQAKAAARNGSLFDMDGTGVNLTPLSGPRNGEASGFGANFGEALKKQEEERAEKQRKAMDALSAKIAEAEAQLHEAKGLHDARNVEIAADRVQALKDLQISQRGEARDKIKERLGMSGHDIAELRRSTSADKRADARADRAFIKKFGSGALQKLKDSKDPAKIAERKAQEAKAENDANFNRMYDLISDRLKFPTN